MEVCNAPEPPVNWQGLLGYLNFSTGKPDPRFQGQLHSACCLPEIASQPDLRSALQSRLLEELDRLHAAGVAGFDDVSQARSAIDQSLGEFPAAYRAHHADLLGPCSDADLFTPFFLARACEAILAARGDDGSADPIAVALERMNDFVGYRPMPVLESRRSGELYDHERFRPVPIYLRGVGVAAGRFQPLVVQAFSILAATDSDLLEEAQFDLAQLEEFALDPRPYDHNHPANRRPNHVFGEWDPHHLDAMGRHRRFVARQSTLDALLARVNDAPDSDRNERLFEASAALAGTMLMSSALCGRSPHAHDSTITLSILVPQIARLRDTFYDRLIAALPGPRGDRLRAEAKHFRQPFGGARQDLNQRIAAERARQLQERHLALLYASLGYRSASQERAARIATPSTRIAAAIRVQITAAAFSAARGELDSAVRDLTAAAAGIHRGIACGALADPWTMLGFQGLYPLFHSREDSLHDPRVEELLELLGDLFGAYAQVLGEAAARGRDDLHEPTLEAMTTLANWWDQFAGYEVSDLPRVHGGEATSAAEHVAEALGRWRQREAAGQPPDLAFWRQHIQGFQTPAAFARVVAALLDRGDLRAAMGLLMAWLSEAPGRPLDDGDHSFHRLARRWMGEAVISAPAADRAELIGKFFELLEANAESLWGWPADSGVKTARSDDDESPYGSAYEGVTFRDSADDGTEGALLGDSTTADAFEFEGRDAELVAHYEFLSTVGQLWRVAATCRELSSTTLRRWEETASKWEAAIDDVLDRLHQAPVPDPPPGLESAIEYDRRRGMKEYLIDRALSASLEIRQGLRGLRGALPGVRYAAQSWEVQALGIERAIEAGDATTVRKALPRFLKIFREEPLLYTPLSLGGTPQQILRARTAQSLLIELMTRLPRLGLLRETYLLIQTARAMEENGRGGRRITEFDRLFPVAVRNSIEAVLDLAAGDHRLRAHERNEALERLAEYYFKLWVSHSESIRLSVLESVDSAVKWERMRGFIQRFGRDLFTTAFLQLANWRAILHRGVDAWFDEFVQSDDAPQDLLDALEGDLPREQAIDLLTTILQALVENFDEYRDYNASTTQSDYGENLHVLFDFLRVKCGYERYNWQLKPLVLVHEVLCRRGLNAEAIDWQRGLIERTDRRAAGHLSELAEVEQRHGVRVRSIRDRLEERFVAPLAIDRIAALLEPAYRAAQAGADESAPAFARLAAEVDKFAQHPIGVGLDLPPWLDRLESDVAELRRHERKLPAPALKLTLESLRDQKMHDWNTPLELE